MVGPQKWDLIIVGSGAGGLVLALELAKKGLQIAILDRQSHPSSLPRGRLSSRTASVFSIDSAFFRNFSPSNIYQNERVDFFQTNGPLLCTIDYRLLPPPYSYSLILLPQVVQDLFLKKIDQTSNISLFWGTTFQGFVYEGTKRTGVEVESNGENTTLRAPVVVGGDGVRSAIRTALQIRASGSSI
ncbi:MAG: FAD-dependent monooxygenase [Candidatus Manganitrophus sp.]|nr:FAD-dependent monooxygenase [Candidatus Manganitrophus sp.]